MKCISRSTLGVVIGIFNIVVYFFASIGCIINIVNDNDTNSIQNNHQDSDDEDSSSEIQVLTSVGKIMSIFILIGCLVMGLVSALLVMGIVKKRHTLMAPWMILSIIGFVISCIRAVIVLVILFSAPVPIHVIFYMFLLICLILGLETVIVYIIYTLYRDIRNKNNERPGQTIAPGNAGSTNAYPAQQPYYTAIPAKA